jgi:long-chain acyl-CoA synthetase
VSALVASFARVVDADPSRRLIHLPAIGSSLTAHDIWKQHSTYGEDLRDCGVRAGDLVLLATGNRASHVAWLLAIRQVEAAALAVDGGTPSAELEALMARFGASAAIVPIEHAAGLGVLRTALPDGLVLVRLPAGSGNPASYRGVAVLKLTSGSTGLPKAARTTDSHLLADTRHIVAAMRIGPDDTQIAAIPLSHAYGASVVLTPMLLQGTPIVLRDSFVPHQLPSDANAYAARVFAGVPFMFDYFLAHPPAGGWPSSLRTLVSAGAPLRPATIRDFQRRFGARIHSFYGTTETGGIAYDAADTLEDLSSVGRPIPGVTVTFRDDEGQEADGGRVYVSSDAVASGYVGDADDEFAGGFLTGDHGTFDASGRLVLTGRVSSFINVAGRKVQPAEVEAVLHEMPEVRDVRVVGAIDPQRGEQVVACIVTEAGRRAPTILAVRRFCAARLAPHKLPRLVVCLEAWPLTERGKVDRRALDEAVRAALADIPEQLC